jgi:hypothetical protein
VKIWPLLVHSSALGAIERTALEPKGRDRAHASSACEVRVVLAAITNLLALCDRDQVSDGI